jgi:hypothetical protein
MMPRVNSVLGPTSDKGPLIGKHRVLWLSVPRAEVVLFRLEESEGLPFFCNLNDVSEWLRTGLLTTQKFEIPYWVQCPEEEITERNKQLRKDRWDLIAPLVSDENTSAIFDRDLRGQLIRERAKETDKDPERFYPLLKLYWRYGQVPNALLPAFPKCSNRGAILEPGERKRGRPPKVVVVGHDPDAIGANVTKSDLINFYACLRELHLRKGMSLVDTYRHMIDRHYSTIEIRGGEVVPIPIPENRKIKLPAFRYWAKRLLEDLTLQREVMGETIWAKKCRGRPGRAADTTNGPSDIFEIDATLDNCYLVSSFNRNHLIGRAIIYYVVDRDTGMITGLHTALEGPSWNTARLALYNAFTDKVAYCKRYGLDISPEEWPCQEECALLVHDQGEILCESARASLQNMLKIDCEINAAGQADRKGTVETKHLQINEPIAWVPGAWRARAEELEKRQLQHLKDSACLTIAERTRILILEALDHNNNIRVERALTKPMIRAGVQPHRRDMYLWGMANRMGEPRRRSDVQQLYRCLLPQAPASITSEGLYFAGMHYLPQDVDSEMLLARARKRRIGLTIHFDPNSTNTVYQLDRGSGSWISWSLSPSCWERYANERLEEVLELRATQQFDAHDAADKEAARSTLKRSKQRAVVKRAKKEKRQAPVPKSKTASRKVQSSSRATERELQRAENILATTGANHPTQSDRRSRSEKNTGSSVINFSSALARRREKVIANRKARREIEGPT